MKKIMIAGTKSGVGKTTISMGLMAALSRRLNVQPFKVGPDYIDSAYHSYITGNTCSNLDSYIMTPNMIQYLFYKNCKEKDFAIIEGVMGLFDGFEVGSDVGTSASIAKLLDVPVILVVDGSKVASSLAATVKGFELFDEDLKIDGVIINNVGSLKHYELLKEAIEFYTNVKPCGYLVKNSLISLPERHLGLVPAGEQQQLQDVFNALAESILSTIDVESIIEIADSNTSMNKHQSFINETRLIREETVRIAIAKDQAFNFYYQDSLDLLTDLHQVTWLPYSPMEDKKLPENIHGLYIGGGFPEVFAKELSNNESMRQDLLDKLEGGLPYIAECGGLMYLSQTLTDLDGQEFSMIGWLAGKTIMTKKLQQFGYATLSLEKDCIFGKVGQKINIHEFHRSRAEIKEPCIFKLEKTRNKKVNREWTCGYMKQNGVAAYAHIHFGSNLNFGKEFVETCLIYKKRGVNGGLH